LQAYVYAGDVFVNAAMVHYGYAEAAAPREDVRYSEYFTALEEGARHDGRGLWRYGDVQAYYKRGGPELAGATGYHGPPARGGGGAAAYQGLPAIGGGGRVFSAPAPFTPSIPSSSGGRATPAPSVGPPATAPPSAPSSRSVPSMRQSPSGRGY